MCRRCVCLWPGLGKFVRDVTRRAVTLYLWPFFLCLARGLPRYVWQELFKDVCDVSVSVASQQQSDPCLVGGVEWDLKWDGSKAKQNKTHSVIRCLYKREIIFLQYEVVFIPKPEEKNMLEKSESAQHTMTCSNADTSSLCFEITSRRVTEDCIRMAWENKNYGHKEKQ